MMKNLMRVRSVWCAVLSAAMVLLVASAWAEFEVVDGVTWYYSVSSGKATIISGNIKYAGNLTIPSTIGKCPVASIGSSAFFGCSELTSVTIPIGVISIGSSAFSGCSGLTTVTIPASVTSVGSSAFSGCSGLMRVDITDLAKWCGISFGNSSANPLCYAYHLCLNGEEVRDLVIPAGVMSINSSAFSGYRGLISVMIPTSVTSIGSSAFSGCSGLMSVTISEGVTSIGHHAFSGCRGLMSVTIPAGVTSIGSSAFSACSGLRTITVDVGNAVYSSQNGILFDKSRKELICCPGGVTGLVMIPAGVTSIYGGAFSECVGLKSVTIPADVMGIGSSAFYGCVGLKSVEFLGMPPNGVENSCLMDYGTASYPREYGVAWQKLFGSNSFPGFGCAQTPMVEIVSAVIRQDDPTVMDVMYKVTSAKPTVKVRALAFLDGERSFAKVVRPTEFIENTAKNIGDGITANVEHKLSWRVSADWKVDLAKLKFEVLVLGGDLLPLELTTIPKVGNHAAMEISWNAITERQVLDAMFWIYADRDERLSIVNGMAFWCGNLAVNGMTFYTNEMNGSLAGRRISRQLGYDYTFTNAIDCVYSKMGFATLSGDELKYANDLTRLGLSPDGVRQYAYRVEKEDGTWGPADGGEDDEGNEPEGPHRPHGPGQDI